MKKLTTFIATIMVAAGLAGAARAQGVIEDRGYTFTIRHQGGYVAKFSIGYMQNGRFVQEDTGRLTVGQSREFHIPSDATDFVVGADYYEIFGGLHSWFIEHPNPGGCVKTWGTVFSPQHGNCN